MPFVSGGIHGLHAEYLCNPFNQRNQCFIWKRKGEL
jgi:hypothetical protein